MLGGLVSSALWARLKKYLDTTTVKAVPSSTTPLLPLLRSLFGGLFPMAPYDSESSAGEDNDYTETNVLLGYASKEASDDTVSHLGGRPVGSRFLEDSLMP